MFGMLDYRAHKLYLILFGIPWFVIRWILILGSPFVYYYIGLSFDVHRIFQIVISLVAMFLIELIVAIVVTYIDKLFMFLFCLLVDVIPADGRSKEEAIAVVKSGEQAIRWLNLFSTHPVDWTDDDLMVYKSSIFTFFYRDKIDQRIRLIKAHYEEHPDDPTNDEFIKEIVSKKGLGVDLLEKVITNVRYRGIAISYSLLAYLLLFNPGK